MNHTPRKLQDFLEDFVDDNTLVDGDELLIDVTPEDTRQLGLFFVRGICGWIHNLNNERRQLVKHTSEDGDETDEAFNEESELAH